MTDEEKGKAFFETHWEHCVKPVNGRDLPPNLWHAMAINPSGDARRTWINAALAYEALKAKAEADE